MLLWIILLLPCVYTGAAANAAPAQKDEAFSRYYADFQNAVKTEDKEKVASLTDFEGFTWESSDSLRQVKTKEAFLKNYNKMFTSTIKSRLRTAKPEKIDDNSYFINWHTKNLEYSLHFVRQGDDGFRFEGLAVGPY
jgi:hypothetical protein